jgi:uncharacterized protein YjiS (DUF1127 family)
MSRISISQGATGARDRSAVSTVTSSLMMKGAAVFDRLVHGRRCRRDALFLSELPDYLLKDIGIQRGMILSAVHHGRGRD